MTKKTPKKGIKLPDLRGKKAPKNSTRLSQTDQDRLREITKGHWVRCCQC